MENFETSLNLFLSELKNYDGNPPQISIDYTRGKIKLIYSPSGFIKQLAKNDKILMGLNQDGISIEYFKNFNK